MYHEGRPAAQPPVPLFDGSQASLSAREASANGKRKWGERRQSDRDDKSRMSLQYLSQSQPKAVTGSSMRLADHSRHLGRQILSPPFNNTATTTPPPAVSMIDHRKPVNTKVSSVSSTQNGLIQWPGSSTGDRLPKTSVVPVLAEALPSKPQLVSNVNSWSASDATLKDQSGTVVVQSHLLNRAAPTSSQILATKTPNQEMRRRIPLSHKAFKQYMQDQLKQVESQHSESAGTWISRANRASGSDRVNTYRTKVKLERSSPFARMTKVSSHRLPKSRDNPSEHILAYHAPSEGHPKADDVTTVYEFQKFRAPAHAIPPYTHYISSKQNILVESVKQRTFLPYLGENDENLDDDYKNLQAKILANQDKTRDLIDGEEFGSIWLPYIDSILETLGTSVVAVLKFLIDVENKSPPRALPKEYHAFIDEREPQKWQRGADEQEGWLAEGFYEEEDDVEATRGEGEKKPRRPQKRWQNALSSLGEIDGPELAAAILACHTFREIVQFSIWHVIRQTPQAVVAISTTKSHASKESHEPNRPTLHAYINQACLVCKAHQCFGHGQYSEDEDYRDIRIPMTSGLDALTLAGKGKQSFQQYADKGASQLQALLGKNIHGAITGQPWAALSNDAHGIDDSKFCSADCFWNTRNRTDERLQKSAWTKQEEQTFLSIASAYYNQARGACAIARLGILDKTCVQIFNRIVRLIPPKAVQQVQYYEDDEARIHKNKSWNWWMQNSNTWKHQEREPFRPCKHSGKCKDNDDCSCFQQGISCEKRCNCPSTCSRRFRGCQCAARGKPCYQSDNCDCFRLNRECDPDICHTCGANEVLDPCNRYNEEMSKGRCCNVSIQRALPKRTQLGQSKLLSAGEISGWGLFMGEETKRGEYIGEYVGEIVTPDEAEQRGIIYNAMNLSYLFNLNDRQVLDSTPIGNKLRYINHQGDEFANCQAKVMFCAGVQRIGMFATKNIEIGEELLFNYGNDFASKIDMVTMHKDGSITVEKGTSGRAAGETDDRSNYDDDTPHRHAKSKRGSSKAKQRNLKAAHTTGRLFGDDLLSEDEEDEEDEDEEGDDEGDEDDNEDESEAEDDDDADRISRTRGAGSKKKTTGGTASTPGGKSYMLSNGMSGSDRMTKAWVTRYRNLGLTELANAQQKKYDQNVRGRRHHGTKQSKHGKKK